MEERSKELDLELGYKVTTNFQIPPLSLDLETITLMILILIIQECFRVFSKDQDGCIPADEIK